jgi:hypothetical protein
MIETAERVGLAGARTLDAGMDAVAQPDALTIACGQELWPVSGDSSPPS